MKTAMQDLKEDLIETLSLAQEPLKEIIDPTTKEACVSVLKETINAIIERINNELLQTEKQQIIDSFNQGFREWESETMTSSKEDVSNFDDAINYYKKTFKP